MGPQFAFKTFQHTAASSSPGMSAGGDHRMMAAEEEELLDLDISLPSRPHEQSNPVSSLWKLEIFHNTYWYIHTPSLLDKHSKKSHISVKYILLSAQKIFSKYVFDQQMLVGILAKRMSKELKCNLQTDTYPPKAGIEAWYLLPLWSLAILTMSSYLKLLASVCSFATSPFRQNYLNTYYIVS